MSRLTLMLIRLAGALVVLAALTAAPARAAQECSPEVEEAIMEAGKTGYETMVDDIYESVLEPAAIKVISCLNDILNSGIQISWGFGLPNLADLFNELANRICNAMNDLFRKATQDLNASFNNDFFNFRIGVRKDQGSLFRINPRIYSPIDGSRVRDLEQRARVDAPAGPTVDVDVVRDLFRDGR